MTLRRRIGITYRVLLALAVAAAFVGLILNTSAVIETAGKAAALCIEVVLPSLFPFMALSGLMTGLGYVREAGRFFAPVMRRLFNLPGACAGPFLLGLVGGYPVGAKSAIALYEDGSLSRAECERLLSFCNNTGPAFIFGVVGAGVFASSAAGAALYAAHALASVTVGLIFRFYKRGEVSKPRLREEAPGETRFSRVFIDSCVTGLASIGNISAFVIIFAVAVELLFSSGVLGALSRGLGALLAPLGMEEVLAERLLVGLIELTSGLSSLASAGASLNARLSLAAFILGWAGISVHCQVLSFIGHSGLRLWPYYTGKLLQAALSAIYVRLIAGLLRLRLDAFAAVERLDFIAGLRPGIAALYSAAGCGLTLLVLLWARRRRSL